jgi:hypothetical protein
MSISARADAHTKHQFFCYDNPIWCSVHPDLVFIAGLIKLGIRLISLK